MAEEVDIVYMKLNQLLKDICQFLDTGINKESLTPDAKKEANNLIKRSKTQLLQISNLRNEYKSGGYMSMDKTLSMKEEPSEPTHKVLPTERSNTSLEIIDENNCLYAELPAKNLPMTEKYGYLSWKIKVIFGIERVQKIYAGIYFNWLLIYRGEKDSKPTHTYNLQNHKAEKSPINNQTNNETHFFLVNIHTKATNQFIAQTYKDMDQWVVRLNKCHQQSQQKKSVIKVDLDTSTHSDDEDEYDIIIVEKHQQKQPTVSLEVDSDNKEESGEEEDIYEDVVMTKPPLPQPVKSSIDRFPMPNPMQRTLPPLPVDRSSSESLTSYDNPILLRNCGRGSINSETSNRSFSDEDEEGDIYDVPSQIEKPVQKKPVQERPLQEKPVQEKPPPVPLYEKKLLPPPKPLIVPKPNILTKPKIDVKIITTFPGGKNSTKKVMKIAQENSHM